MNYKIDYHTMEIFTHKHIHIETGAVAGVYKGGGGGKILGTWKKLCPSPLKQYLTPLCTFLLILFHHTHSIKGIIIKIIPFMKIHWTTFMKKIGTKFEQKGTSL